jgi:hypothetical protein
MWMQGTRFDTYRELCNLCCCAAGRELLTTYEKVHQGFWKVMRGNLLQASYISTQRQQSEVRWGVSAGGLCFNWGLQVRE